MNSSQLILIDANLRDVQLLQIIRRNEVRKWVAFIPDYARILELEDLLRPYALRIGTGRELQETAHKLRRPFYRLTAQLGDKYNSLEWWSSSISERNTMNSRLFLNCCYVFVAKDFLNMNDDMCIICDSVPVLKTISNIAKNSHKVFLYKSRSLERYFLQGYTRRIAALFYNMIVGWRRWLVARVNLLYHQILLRKRIKKLMAVDFMLHTWVAEKCFGSDGKFHDGYFGVLPQWLREKDYDVCTLVTIFSTRRSYWKALNFFRLRPGDYIIPEDFHRIYDYLFPLWLYLKKLRFKYKGVILSDVDVTSLFYEEKQKDPASIVTMYYILMKRLAENHVKPSVIIDGFENMISDKMIILGAKKYLKGTIVNGFFHLPVTSNILCNFIDSSEVNFAPLPDQIICNGELYQNLLVEQGYPSDKLATGTALRYTYLWDRTDKGLEKPEDGIMRVLIPLPLAKGAAIELIQKAMGALETTDYKIYLKPHPMGLEILNELPNSVTSRIEALSGPMDDALSKADVILTAATSSALDGVLSGKPVIRIARESEIDFDPLVGLGNFGEVYFREEQIRKAAEEYEHRLNQGKRLVDYDPDIYLRKLFAPPNEEYLSVFIPEALKKD
jgi:hypothetical protein